MLERPAIAILLCSHTHTHTHLNIEQQSAGSGAKQPRLLEHDKEDLSGHCEAADGQVADRQINDEDVDARRRRGGGSGDRRVAVAVVLTAVATHRTAVGEPYDHRHVADEGQHHQGDDGGDALRHFRCPHLAVFESLQRLGGVAAVCRCRRRRLVKRLW